MKYFKYLSIILLISVITINLNCTSKLDEDIIAQVDDFKITRSEFQLRYNFNPYLKDINSELTAKKIVLSSLIAEKLLYIESKKNHTASEALKSLKNQYLKEAMIEQIHQDSIESQIEVTDNELRKEYLKSLKEIDIKFVAFNSLNKAQAVKKEIDILGSFDKPIRKYMNQMGWQNLQIPTKKIVWAKENFELEQNIYDLSKGETSNPVFANNEYYLIQVTKISSIADPNDIDYADRLPALQDRLRRHKINKKYAQFYEKNIKDKMGKVDWNLYREIVDVMVSEIQFNKNVEISDQNKPLSEIGYNSLLERIRQNMDRKILQYPDSESWSIKDVLENLNSGPYVFNFKNETLFRRSCARNIELMQEYHVIYKIAKNKNYESDIKVNRQFKIWDSFYSASEYRQSLLGNVNVLPTDSLKFKDSKLSLIQNKRLTVFDDYISKISDNYSIRINKELFENIKLNKQDMVVVKSHFANRLIAPPLEPLLSLSKWSKKFDTILLNNQIQ